MSALSNPPTLQRVWRGTSSPLCCFVLSPTHTQRDKWEFVKLFVYLRYKLPAASWPHTAKHRRFARLFEIKLDFSGWKAQKTTSWCVFNHFSEARNFKLLSKSDFFPPGWWNSLYFSFRFHSFQIYSPSHWKSSVWPDDRVHYAVCIDCDRYCSNNQPDSSRCSAAEHWLNRWTVMTGKDLIYCELWLTASELKLKLTGSSSIFPGNKCVCI